MFTPSFPPADATARAALLDWIREAPLVYGPWQHFKRLYKDAEAAYLNGEREPEIMAALLRRLDEQSLERASFHSDVAVAGNFGALCVGEGFAYVWSRGRELQTYDLSAPAQPRLVATWSPALVDPISVQLVLSEGKLWIQNGGKLWLLDLRNPAAPALEGSFDTRSFQTTIAGGRVITLNSTTLRVLEVRDGALVEIGTSEFIASYYGVMGGPNFAAALNYDYSGRRGRYYLQFADLSDAANPRLAGKLDSEYATELKRSGEHWVSLVDGRLVIYDFADADKPREIGRIKADGARMATCDANRAAVLCMNWTSGGNYEVTLRLFDLSRPHAPRLIGEHQMEQQRHNEITALALAGEMLYLATRNGLRLFDISDPSRAQEIGKSPSAQTFAYLKRRGRRLLRQLSQVDGDAFTALAAAFFSEIATRPNLDFDNHWIAADLVAACHPIWYQASHGRGAYLPRAGADSVVIGRRVERAPDAWDAHRERLSALARTSVTAPVVQLARQVNAATAPLSPAQIESYVASPWPNLRVIGARAAFAANVETLSPRAIAGALVALGAAQRRELLERAFAAASIDVTAIASELANYVGRSLPVERDKFGRRVVGQALTRRGREIALLLVARFDLSDPAFRADGALPALRALLNAGEAPLRSLGAQFCRRLSANQVLPLVPFAVANAAVLEALMESAARADFDKAQIDKAIRVSARAERAAAWQLVANSQTAGATLGAVWLSLLRGLTQSYDWNARTISWRISDALSSALAFADARAALVRGALDWREVRPRWSGEFVGTDATAYYSNAGAPGEVFAAYALFLPPDTVARVIAELPAAKWGEWKAQFVAAIAPHADVCAGFWGAVQLYLNGKNENVGQLRARTFNDPAVAATFAGAAGQLPPALLLSLIASVSDAVWNAWRVSLLRVLQSDAARREAFWDAARLQGFESELLRARLIGDAELAATFGLLESDVMQFDDPALETLLLQWLRARDLDGETLIEAAIHPLPAVRAIGLSGLTERGLNVPIALRLLESDLRDAMETAKSWFDAQSENIANLALALCDSPRSPVREWGREFVGARLDDLLGDGLLGKLEENPNAEMQGFVAQLLLNRNAVASAERLEAEPLEFDRAVLRGRNRARRAKNLVQTRRAQGAPLPDDATLLELARGKTPRDASWALEQLARRAMESEVAGVEIGGVGAI